MQVVAGAGSWTPRVGLPGKRKRRSGRATSRSVLNAVSIKKDLAQKSSR